MDTSNAHDHDHDHDDHDHDRGLQFDLDTLFGRSPTHPARPGTLVARRRLFGLVAGAAGATMLASCGLAGATRVDGPGTATSGTLTETPEETAGPYPADGSNGMNVLTESGVVRGDIRSSFGGSTTTAPGVPLTIRLIVRDTTGTALAGHAVYLWHCDRDGAYSMYTLPQENYLRGVQETGTDGSVTFTSVVPGCYDGRWPHIHYEVYPSLGSATSASDRIGTSQLALPQETCDLVYATAGYERSVDHMTRVSLSTDNVFRDGWTSQLAAMAGDVTGGLTATVTYVV